MKRKNISNSFIFFIGAMALGALVSRVVQAQVLDEVIVVAQKKDESIQKVPISIIRFDSEKLTDLGIDELKNIGANMPGVYVNTFNGDPGAVRLFIRGVGGNSVQISQDPSVALYLDGVYVGTAFGTGFEGVDISSMEVLRGPQGTLYGRNATGGAVNIVSTRASTDALAFNQKVTGGNLGLFKSRTSINVPLADELAIKLTYLASKRDGTVKNRGPGADFGEEDRKSLVTDLHWSPRDDLTLDYRFERADMRDSQRYEQITMLDEDVPLASWTEFRKVGKARQDSVTALRLIPRNKLDIRAHTLHVNWAMTDHLELRSITAQRKFDSVSNSDTLSTAEGTGTIYSGSPSTLNIFVGYKQFSQEFQLIGDTDRLSYIAGLYYFDSDADWNNRRQVTIGRVLGDNFSNAKNKSRAIYAQATYTPQALGEQLHLIFGARFSRENREVHRTNLNTTPQFQNARYNKDFSNFNPAFTIGYDITNDISIYGKIMTGFKSGGTAMSSANLQLFARGFDEEEVKSYEIGLKSMFFDNSLRLNLAAFRSEMDGAQTAVQTGPSPSARDFLPVDGNVFQGLELDLEKQITESLYASIGYSYLDTKVGEKFVDSTIGRTSLTSGFPYAPKRSLSVVIRHEIPLGSGYLRSLLSYTYQDKVTSSVNVADNSVLAGYSLVDFSMTWGDIKLGTISGDFSIQLWGRNLLDEEYTTISTASWHAFGAAEVDTYGDPRTCGVTVGYHF